MSSRSLSAQGYYGDSVRVTGAWARLKAISSCNAHSVPLSDLVQLPPLRPEHLLKSCEN
ncbi:hypothetical protein M378DRAFT_170292 [Amanita muscaria Koide BX008]|uniref:Uncharacterized protein n=1 Tax=Amanita muscaria (strain Koide BX008) TaxID=946122 RepID=A0A0C2WBJ7_AMAMK|nr:hypothetical protein M378DRAFT_170292 [Amanita muscaria Koide BX008]